jgi:glucose/arabinose dehydrogenase
VPPGFKVEAFATGLASPRLLRTAPNGDIFAADSRNGTIQVLRPGKAGQPAAVSTYADDLNYPFGIAFYPPGADPQYLFVACVNAVLRYPYKNGDARPGGEPKVIVPSLPTGGHVTRDVIFSPDGKKMYVSVGSGSNDAEGGSDEAGRADILEFNPDGSGGRHFATAISGRRSMSATGSATTCRPIMSRGSRRASSSAGPGTISARIRIRATRASAPISAARSPCRTY